MKWQVGISAVFVAAVFTGASLVKHDREEKKAHALFAKAVREGDRVYGDVCSACHGRYDPRFHMFEEWNRILEDTGCPAVRVDLSMKVRDAIRDFLRAKAAPTEKEAETVRDRERSRTRSERSRRGAKVFKNACLHCHGHPYFPKTLTGSEWIEAVRDLGGLHRDLGEPVRVDEKDGSDLKEYLSSEGAGTPSDARAIRAMISSGTAPVEAPVEAGTTEIHWVRDHDAGIKEAAENKKPVIVELTDLSGG